GAHHSPTRGKFLAMPRGRHRHSPPLHRMLPPSAIAGVSLVCALGPWVFTQPTALRLLAAVAAATAITGAVVMRRWDTQAGKRVADLTRARASDEWRFEERTAELESDLEESRELRIRLEQRLRAKRAELAGLRNEHAALLRRYATAEADRASVLEERRVLEIEATVPARALPAGASATAGAEGAEDPETARSESRELRIRLEQRLRAKRAELAGLRNEHAALLRRYATAEADRASVLEERRVLEIEATVPARALPAGASATAGAEGAEDPETA